MDKFVRLQILKVKAQVHHRGKGKNQIKAKR